jgi:hypothetical protein
VLPLLSHNRDPVFRRLLDEVCMHAAAMGQVLGFDGRLVQVHPASPAQQDAGPAQQQQEHAGAAAAASAGGASAVLQASSIAEALSLARDGDVLQLLPGTHVVSEVRLLWAVAAAVVVVAAAAAAAGPARVLWVASHQHTNTPTHQRNAMPHPSPPH